MQLMLSAFTFITIVSLAIFILKTRAKRERGAIVGLIFLSTSSVAIALAFNSMYSLAFFALHWMLLLIAIILAFREQREQTTKVEGK